MAEEPAAIFADVLVGDGDRLLAAELAGGEARLGAGKLAGEEVLRLAGSALVGEGDAVRVAAAATANDDVVVVGGPAGAGRRADRSADPVLLDLGRLPGRERSGPGRRRRGEEQAAGGKARGEAQSSPSAALIAVRTIQIAMGMMGRPPEHC